MDDICFVLINGSKIIFIFENKNNFEYMCEIYLFDSLKRFFYRIRKQNILFY